MRIVVFATLVILGFLSIKAQNKSDTSRVNIPKNILIPLNDSLIPDRKSNLPSLLPPRRYVEKPSFLNYKVDDPLPSISYKSKKSYDFFDASYARYIIPTAMISYGITTRFTKGLQDLDQDIHQEVDESFTRKIPLDDYSRYAPLIAVYGLDLLGLKANHNFRDKTFVVTTSYLITSATVTIMKNNINVWRPNNTNQRSFPSMHTAVAFVGAHILYKEYKDVSPWIGVAGYTTASLTGILRVINKCHWASDVITGAGIGLLSVELSYLLLPVFHKILGVEGNGKNLAVMPSINTHGAGISLAYAF